MDEKIRREDDEQPAARHARRSGAFDDVSSQSVCEETEDA